MYIATPQCEHPHWISLDPFTNDVVAIAADTPPMWTLTTENNFAVAVAVVQCERTLIVKRESFD